jgi:hypothetical protein
LVLRQRGNPTSDRELNQDCFDRCRSQIGGLALAVEPDEAFNPIDVGVRRPDAVSFKANPVSDAG